MLMLEQPELGTFLEERVVEPSVSELKGQVSFECGSWDFPLKSSLVTMWELMKPSWCPHPNASLIWDMTTDIVLDFDDDTSLHDLAVDTSSAGIESNQAKWQTIYGTLRGKFFE